MARNLIASDQTIKAVKPGDLRKRLNDGDGLFLLLFVKGGAHGWRFAYSLHGKRNNLSLGVYPDVGLAQARKSADAARTLVAAGADPSETRKSGKVDIERKREADRRADAGLPSADSFEGVAREWHDTRKGDWSISYGEKILARLVADVFPYIGRRPIGEITPPQLLEVLRRVESRGVIETAHRARENCSQVFRFAIATGRAERDAARDLSDALKKPQVKHFAAITDPKRLGELLRACHGYTGTPVVRTALRLAPMLMLRPGELRHAEWSEIDLDTATWTVPAQRMKREKAGKMNGVPHIVPLPTQAVEAFRDLEPLTGGGQWVFRGERHHDRPMSENTVNAALRAMGFPADEATGHGFRATARTMLAERLNVDASIVEAQLAHSVRDSLGRAYNRTEFLAQRRSMMQSWADYLDQLRTVTRTDAAGRPSLNEADKESTSNVA
jgi:integrase